MKKSIIALGSCLLMSNIAVASSFSDTAEIISVKEIFRTETIRTPYQVCEEKMGLLRSALVPARYQPWPVLSSVALSATSLAKVQAMLP